MVEIDSYYEYLLKSWLLFGDRDCERMWMESIPAVNKYLADEFVREGSRQSSPELWYGHADMNTGKRTTTTYFYLLFAPPKALAFDQVTFNTEAHPVRKTWK